MSKLVPVRKLRDSLALEDHADLNAMVESALRVATNAISSVLTTSFDRVTQTDRFSLVDSPVLDLDQSVLTFKLSRGFVDTTQPITIKAADVAADLATADAIVQDNVFVDASRGYVTFMDLSVLDGKFLSIAYTAGFTTIPDNESKRYAQVPESLEQAALLAAAPIYEYEAALKSKNKTTTIVKPPALPALTRELLIPFMRVKGAVVLPI